MKGTYVIVIAFMALMVVNATSLDEDDLTEQIKVPTECPYPSEENPNNTTTNLPHEHNCSRFYKCFIGSPVSQECPLMREGDPVTRLHYNRLLQVCDWPWTAGCESCPQKYPNGTYPPSSRINDGTGCNYYECINGVPWYRVCPPGTCFSRTCQECVVNRNGGYCGGRTTWSPTWSPTTPTTPTTLDPWPRCDSSADDGNVKDLKCDCKVYYVCKFPHWWRHECEGGLHFNVRAKECQPPNEAGCWTPKE